MQRLKILIWHIHGSYLNTLARIDADWYLPVKPGRPEGYGGRGPTFDLLGEFAEYDPQETAISGAFVAAFNGYVREDLKFGQDKTYRVAADGAGRQWDWKHQGGENFGFPGSPNVEGDLVGAMISNPHLQIEVENGIYDLATPFLATEYTMDHLDLTPQYHKNISYAQYEAGHMVYLDSESHAKMKQDFVNFIDQTTPKAR